MPYLHLGVVQPPTFDDAVVVEDGDSELYATKYPGINEVIYDMTAGPPPVLYATPSAPAVEVHTLDELSPDTAHLPDLVANAKPVNWLLIAALAAGLWALSQGGGGSHKGWE